MAEVEHKEIEIGDLQRSMTELASVQYQTSLSKALGEASCNTIALVTNQLYKVVDNAPPCFEYTHTIMKPPAPRSAQELFQIDRKNAQKNETVQGKSWTQLTTEEKEPYEKRAREFKAEYDQQLQLYVDSRVKKPLSNAEMKSRCLQHVSNLRKKCSEKENEVSHCLLQTTNFTQPISGGVDKPVVISGRGKRLRSQPTKSPSTTSPGKNHKESASGEKSKKRKNSVTEEVLESGELPKDVVPNPKRQRAPAGEKKKTPGQGSRFVWFRRDWVKLNPDSNKKGANEKWKTMSDVDKNNWWTKFTESGGLLEAKTPTPRSKSAKKAPPSMLVPSAPMAPTLALLTQLPQSTPASSSSASSSSSSSSSMVATIGTGKTPMGRPNVIPLTFNTLAAASQDQVSSARSTSSEYSQEEEPNMSFDDMFDNDDQE